MKKLIAIAAIILSFNCLFAQVTFVKGYMITLKGDTVKGEVKINPKRLGDNFTKLFFKDNEGVQKNYKPDKVKGYGYEGKHFIAEKFGDEICFYKILAKGKVTLYEMVYEEYNVSSTYFKSEYYFSQEGDKEFTRIKQGKFKKQLSDVMKDNTEFIQNATEDEKKFEIEKVIDIVNQYNAWAKTNG